MKTYRDGKKLTGPIACCSAFHQVLIQRPVHSAEPIEICTINLLSRKTDRPTGRRSSSVPRRYLKNSNFSLCFTIVFCLLRRGGHYLSSSIVRRRKSRWWIITSNYHRSRSTIAIIVFPENKPVHIETEAVTLDFTRKYFPRRRGFAIFFRIVNVRDRISLPRVQTRASRHGRLWLRKSRHTDSSHTWRSLSYDYGICFY